MTGFTIILVSIFFIGSVQLVSIGILGEYIGRIYEEVKGRPLYTLAEISDFSVDDIHTQKMIDKQAVKAIHSPID